MKKVAQDAQQTETDAAASQQGVRRGRSASNKIDRRPPRPAKKSQTDSHVSPPPRPLSPMQDSTTQNVADDGPAGATAQLNLVTGSVGLQTAAVPWDGQTLQSAIEAVSQPVPADSQAPQENSAAASQVPAPQTPEPQPQDSAAASLGNQAEKRQIKSFLDDHPELGPPGWQPHCPEAEGPGWQPHCSPEGPGCQLALVG